MVPVHSHHFGLSSTARVNVYDAREGRDSDVKKTLTWIISTDRDERPASTNAPELTDVNSACKTHVTGSTNAGYGARWRLLTG